MKRLLVLSLLGLSFVWGYKRVNILSAWADWRTGEHSAPVAAIAAPELTAVLPPPSGAGEPVVSKQIAPPPRAPDAQSNPIYAFPNANPSQGLPPQNNTLSGTLDSIRPSQVEPQQIVQRNAYFEKLSQQLRDLQGGTPDPNQPQNNPPPPADAGSNNYPPSNMAQTSDAMQPPPPPPPPFPVAGNLAPGLDSPEVEQPPPPGMGFDQQTNPPEIDEVDDIQDMDDVDDMDESVEDE